MLGYGANETDWTELSSCHQKHLNTSCVETCNWSTHHTKGLASHLTCVTGVYSTSYLMKIHIHSIRVHTSCVASCSRAATHQSVMWCVSTLPLTPSSSPSDSDFLHFLEALLANSTEQMLRFPRETQLNNVVICAAFPQNATCLVIWYNKSNEDPTYQITFIHLVWLSGFETQCWFLTLRHWTH